MIMFSYDIFVAQTTGGVSRCMIELMRALGNSTDWRLWAGRYRNDLLSPALLDPAIADHIMEASAGRGGRFAGALVNEPGFAAAVSRQSASLVHRTYYPVFDLLPRHGLKRVETLLDMWDERSGAGAGPLTGLKTRIKRRALHRADAIVCISDSSRTEMVELWPALETKSTVIHLGVRSLSPRPLAAGRDRPYFIFVGRRGSYKNFAVALAGLRAAHLPDHDLVAFGGGAFDAVEAEAIHAAGLTGRVVQIDGGDDRLAGLYEGATALLYPSCYEGFGLPLLEAMIHGCPVIATPQTSLPEVGGDAALYAQPSRPDEWARLMEKIVEDADFCAAVKTCGRARAARFSWSTTAEKHAKLYVDVGG